MLYFNLAPVFKARAITHPLRFMIKAGFSRHTATNLLRTDYRQPMLDHIERLCNILNCTPNDILAWQPASGTALPATHQLHTLAPKTLAISFLDDLKTLPLDQVEQMQRIFTAEMENNQAQKSLQSIPQAH